MPKSKNPVEVKEAKSFGKSQKSSSTDLHTYTTSSLSLMSLSSKAVEHVNCTVFFAKLRQILKYYKNCYLQMKIEMVIEIYSKEI